MADVKISALPASTTPLAGTEVLPVVQSGATVQVSVANLTAGRAVSALSLSLTSALPVASGGTNATTASITSFNNITGYTASGATGTTSTNLVFSTTPTITTPVLTNPTVSGYVESVVAITLTSAGAVGTLVITAGTVLTATLSAGVPCTFAMPTSPTAGQSFILRLTQAATGMTTATFTGVKWPGGTAPTITATASAVDIISFVYIGTSWYGNAAQAFA